MATTPEAAQLTNLHRRRQLALRALTLQQLVALWPLFDIRAIDETWARLEPVLMAIIDLRRNESATLATAYYRAFREAERVPGAPPNPFRLVTDWQAAAEVSLRVTGPVAAKELVKMKRPDAAEQTLVKLSGSLGRQAINGGREMLLESVRRDSRARGWARVTAFNPCAFCAMLASRGPVYSKARGGFQAHDHCACSLEPAYSTSSAWPGRGREFQQLWQSTTQDAGRDAFTVFRRAYEGRAA